VKNIVLQHYTGTPGELEKLSIDNISKYAERIGADYQFIQGDVFRKGLSAPCQKLHMLDEKWDEYDGVVMMDIDMFAVNDLQENVFTDISGIGLFTEYTVGVFQSCRNRHPFLCDPQYAYWGGCLWRLPNKEFRQKFRAEIREHELIQFSGNYEDEGIMHRLAVLTKTKPDPIPRRWSQCSYLPEPEKAAIIHIRTKITPQGPKRTKIENYRYLNEKGIIQ
jgi:hypothetical protein